MGSCPYTVSSEKIVAEQFADIIRVVLEPFEIDLADFLYRVLVVFVEFSEIDSEMTVMPVRS